MDQIAVLGKTPLVLVTGFLGSGKTSLLKNLLRKMPPDIRIAVVQNEFAPGQADSAVLAAANRSFQLLEINNGSVFCACLLDTFVSRLDTFLELHQPGIILLEATGLADPVSMAQILQAPKVSQKIYLAGIWTVVDLVHFNQSLQFITRVRHQIQMADLILLNKSDLRSADEITASRLDTWNPGALRLPAVHGDFPSLEDRIRTLLAEPVVLQAPAPGGNTLSAGRPDLGSAVIRTQRPLEPERVRDFTNRYPQRILRMKGFIRTSRQEILMIQLIFDQLTIEKVDFWTGATELLVMGHQVTARWVMEQLIN